MTKTKQRLISPNLYFLLFIIFISSNTNVLLAQEYEYYPSEEVKSIITASADNYFPKLNEPVKLKLKIIIPKNTKVGEIALGFAVWDGKNDTEILSGQQWNKEEFKKDQIVEMEMTVKFTNQMVAQIQASYSKNIFVMLPFYVDGGFRESSEVKDLRENIKNQKEWIEKAKSGIHFDSLPLIHGTEPNKVSKHSVFTLTNYEKTVLKESEKQNKELFINLKKEYDSLDTIVKNLAMEMRKKRYLDNHKMLNGDGQTIDTSAFKFQRIEKEFKSD